MDLGSSSLGTVHEGPTLASPRVPYSQRIQPIGRGGPALLGAGEGVLVANIDSVGLCGRGPVRGMSIGRLAVSLGLVAFALANTTYAQLATGALKPYRSEAGAFEVSYPDDWSASAEEKGNSAVVVFTSPPVRDDDVFHAASIMVCSTPINKAPWNDCTERDSHLSEPYRDRVRSREEFSAASGLIVERVATVSNDDDAFFYYARVSSKGRSFFVRGDFKKSFNLARYAPAFDKMLKSFRLL